MHFANVGYFKGKKHLTNIYISSWSTSFRTITVYERYRTCCPGYKGKDCNKRKITIFWWIFYYILCTKLNVLSFLVAICQKHCGPGYVCSAPDMCTVDPLGKLILACIWTFAVTDLADRTWYSDWLFICCFTSHSRIFRSHKDVTINDEGLYISASARHLRSFSREGSLSCHTCCNTVLRCLLSHPWIGNLVAFYDEQKLLRIYSKLEGGWIVIRGFHQKES